MTERRWMKTVITESRKNMPQMPWSRKARTDRAAAQNKVKVAAKA